MQPSCISSLLYWEKLLADAPQIRRFNPYYPAQRNYCCPGTAEGKEKTEWKPWHLYSQKQSSARATILLFLEQARIHQVFCILHSSGILMSTPSSKRRYPFTASCQCDVAPRRAQTIPQHHLIFFKLQSASHNRSWVAILPESRKTSSPRPVEKDPSPSQK